MMQPLILASGSSVRAALLHNAGLEIEIKPARIDERRLEKSLETHAPETIACALAEAKMLHVSSSYPERVILGADQTMALGDEIFHKPETITEAIENLKRLSGKTHRLYSAVSIGIKNEILWSYVSTATLTMRELKDNTIEFYTQKAGEAILSSVGCYQLEKQGSQLFEAIEGDTFTILGLPLLQLLSFLRSNSTTSGLPGLI
jgi:septum formation protein